MTVEDRAPHRDRIAFILGALTKEGHVDIDELAGTLHVSTATIRRDLDGLAQFQLLVLGGVVRPASYELIGSLAERNLAEMTLDEVILSANGLSSLSGASCNNLGEAAIGRQMIARSKHVTLVIDSSKFGVSCLATMCRPA